MSAIRKGAMPVLAVLGVVAAAACAPAEHEAPTAPAAVEATVGRVERVDWPSVYEAGGVVRAAQVAVISSRVVAPVAGVSVVAGDRVTRGQALVTLDAREVAANLDRATAAENGTRLALEAARSERRAAEAALALARATHQRVRGLRDKNSATAAEMDRADAELTAAEARAEGAAASVAAGEAGLAAAAAAREAASVGASYAVLTAPFSGRVANRQVDAGALAAPGVPLLTVEDESSFRLEVRVDESRVQGLAPGAAAEVRLDGAGDAWTPTTVVEIASVDPALHSALVKIAVPAREGLRAGAFGRARFFGASAPTLSAPAAAIVRRGQLAFAFVIDADGAARLRMVSPGRVSADIVEVLAGLVESDRVVVNPPPSLQDGTPIRGAGGAGASR